MASTVTRLDLRTRIRDRGEFLAPFHTDTMLNAWINDSLADLYDLLSALDPSRYRSTQTVTVVSGTESYALSADFLSLQSVDLVDSAASSGHRPMERYDFRNKHAAQYSSADKYTAQYDLRAASIYFYPIPGWSGSVLVTYTPTPTSLDDDVTTFDSVNAWTEYVVADCCIKCAARGKEDPTVFIATKMAAEKRIGRRPRSDQARPKTVANVRGRRYRRHGTG